MDAYTAQANAIKLRTMLLTLLDQIDYTRGACSPSNMVGACLDSRLLDQAHKLLEETKPVQEG